MTLSVADGPRCGNSKDFGVDIVHAGYCLIVMDCRTPAIAALRYDAPGWVEIRAIIFADWHYSHPLWPPTKTHHLNAAEPL
jgi:hypothetical protein